MTENEKTAAVSSILAKWNPAGDAQSAAAPKIDYAVEAADILWAMKLYGYPVKKAVSEVLQEAFFVEIEQKDLEHYAHEIEEVLAQR